MAQSQNAPEPPTAAALADVLDQAAAHLERVGLCQRAFYDSGQFVRGTPMRDCRVCASGAIGFAIHGSPDPEDAKPEHMATERLAHQAVNDHLSYHREGPRMVEYNDAPGRTSLQVQDVLRATASRLRRGALPVPH